MFQDICSRVVNTLCVQLRLSKCIFATLPIAKAV